MRILHPLVRAMRNRPRIEGVVKIRIERLPSLAIFEVSIAIYHTTAAQFAVADGFAGLVMAVGKQVMAIPAHIVIRGPGTIINRQVALVDVEDFLRRPNDSG